MGFVMVGVSLAVLLVAGYGYLLVRLWPLTLLVVLGLFVSFMAGRSAGEIALVTGLVVAAVVVGVPVVLVLRRLGAWVERTTVELTERRER